MTINQGLSDINATAFPVFHAFTEGNITSLISWKRKCKDRSAWDSFVEATTAFCAMIRTRSREDVMDVLLSTEKYVILI